MTLTPAIAQMCQDTGFVGSYREWLKLPMTRQVLSMLQEAHEATRMTGGGAEAALYYAGAVDEARNLLAMLRDMDGCVKIATPDRKAVMPASTYGTRQPVGEQK
jgi:hypothetical protein